MPALRGITLALVGLAGLVGCGGDSAPPGPTPAPRPTHLEFDSPRLETSQTSVAVDRVDVDLEPTRARWSFVVSCRSATPCRGRLRLTAVVPREPQALRVMLEQDVSLPTGGTVTMVRSQSGPGVIEDLDRVEIVFTPEEPATPGKPQVRPTPLR